ncbi:MAG TPA: 4-hydroxy-tetrahydrodipicolinate synthase [Candidatus Taylorbacteria bacterium]|nr:MAG: Dihydrodipicolinate synthase [Parcubacteria group bacterium GW2011_GWF2_50_9]HCB35735.1 4-hydroxy-tetrahydrodipicolinate synthase [Candidatus Taylorbacteria bacterium]
MHNNEKQNRSGSANASRATSFCGTYTAIITPFTAAGYLDKVNLQRQITRQIEGGVNGIVPVGTTGESSTLDFTEHISVVAFAVQVAAGRMQVLAGTGANSTSEAISLAKAAEDAGADSLLQVVPYYNKPSQEGLFQHFKAVADATRLPIILYNIPGRCGIDITIDTVCRLREARSNIAGIKVANGSSDYVTELRARAGQDFAIFSGDDSLTLPFISVGACGAISVVSNIFPEHVVQMVSAALLGNLTEAKRIHAELFPLIKSIFLEGNPVGVKSAMEHIGLDSGAVRPPLVKVSSATAAAIHKALSGFLNRAPAH